MPGSLLQNDIISSTIHTVGLVIVAIIIGAATFFGVQTYQKIKAQDLKNQAIRDCGAVSQFSYEETTKDGKTTRSTEPNKPVYKTCVEDKGYTTTVQLQ